MGMFDTFLEQAMSDEIPALYPLDIVNSGQQQPGAVVAQNMSTGQPAYSDPYQISAPFAPPQAPQLNTSFLDKSPLAQFTDVANSAYQPGYITMKMAFMHQIRRFLNLQASRIRRRSGIQ